MDSPDKVELSFLGANIKTIEPALFTVLETKRTTKGTDLSLKRREESKEMPLLNNKQKSYKNEII